MRRRDDNDLQPQIATTRRPPQSTATFNERWLKRGLEHLGRVPLLSRLADHAPAVGIKVAKTKLREPALAAFIHQTTWATFLAAEVEPMQCRTTTRFKVRLVPHDCSSSKAAGKRKAATHRGVQAWQEIPAFLTCHRHARVARMPQASISVWTSCD